MWERGPFELSLFVDQLHGWAVRMSRAGIRYKLGQLMEYYVTVICIKAGLGSTK